MTNLEHSENTSTESATGVPDLLVRATAWSWRLLVVGAAIVFTAWALVQLRVVVLPIFVALLLAALLTPVVNLVDRRLPRMVATWLTVLVVAALLGLLSWLLQAPIRDAVDDLVASWDSTVSDVEDWLRNGPLSLSQERIDTLYDRIDTASRQFVSGFVDSPGTAARSAVEFVGGTFLALVLTFFFLKDGPSMWAWALDRVHEGRRPYLDTGGRAAFGALQGWIRGVAITGVVDALLIGGALVILDVPAAIPLTVITFFSAFFPIVGATLAGGLATLIALATVGPRTAIIVALVVIVVQQVEGDVVLPIVMKRQISLHPVVVLLALAVGAALGGIVGAIIAVPLAAAGTAAARAMHSSSAAPDPPPTERTAETEPSD